MLPPSEPLNVEVQQWLLDLARRTLERYAAGHEAGSSLPLPVAAPEPANQPEGTFVTLRHRSGELRGCMGHIESAAPLWKTVMDCTVSAAFYDPRFLPVSSYEVPELRIEISVLSPLFEIAADQIEVGRHGLLITEGANRGVLLPKVPLDWGWSREQFLEATCRKAGLPPDAWQTGAHIQAFTSQMFAEPHELAATDRRIA
jgi:AmmeMemoRadiSam system protein A